MSAFRSAFEKRDARQVVDQRDEGGERVLAGRRATGRSAISESALQRAVAHDLETLMNTVHLAATDDLEPFDHVRSSILNHGFPDVLHRTMEEHSVGDLAHEIRSALTTFEPRLKPETLQVKRDDSVDSVSLKIRFVVRADLNCDPLNVPVEFVAELERDTGRLTIARR